MNRLLDWLYSAWDILADTVPIILALAVLALLASGMRLFS